MEFARIGLLGALLIGMWKGSSTTRNRTTPGSAGSEHEAWSYQRGVEGPEKEPIQNRHGSFNADQTPGQRIAELDLWLRELERNRF
jgi:hypothetical protein